MNELIWLKNTKQCLAYSKCSMNVYYYFFYLHSCVSQDWKTLEGSGHDSLSQYSKPPRPSTEKELYASLLNKWEMQVWKSTSGPVVTQYSTQFGLTLSPNIYWDLPFLYTLVWNKFICYFLETGINKRKEKDTENPGALEKEEQRAQGGNCWPEDKCQ